MSTTRANGSVEEMSAVGSPLVVATPARQRAPKATGEVAGAACASDPRGARSPNTSFGGRASAGASPANGAKGNAVDVQLKKTKMCLYFSKGKCASATCNYAHSPEELRDQPNLKKTKLCKAFLQKTCRAGANCPFAHGDEELRITEGVYKTQICQFFAQGFCKKGVWCNHAHGDADLCVTKKIASASKPLASVIHEKQAVQQQQTTMFCEPASPSQEVPRSPQPQQQQQQPLQLPPQLPQHQPPQQPPPPPPQQPPMSPAQPYGARTPQQHRRNMRHEQGQRSPLELSRLLPDQDMVMTPTKSGHDFTPSAAVAASAMTPMPASPLGATPYSPFSYIAPEPYMYQHEPQVVTPARKPSSQAHLEQTFTPVPRVVSSPATTAEPHSALKTFGFSPMEPAKLSLNETMANFHFKCDNLNKELAALSKGTEKQPTVHKI